MVTRPLYAVRPGSNELDMVIQHEQAGLLLFESGLRSRPGGAYNRVTELMALTV